ncbi:methyl-accepting chemotaxis protein [Solimonas flava]|uniref:methyl-accepting chemotaxis protein n=1 Tax=Solimonas flava TaxID=415849 RepID=UPI0003F55E10|nr:methyl-accepting chemotaxis protein [Solimonas flava]
MLRFRLKVGQRLALGFGAVLSLLVVAVGAAIYFQRVVGDSTRSMLDDDVVTMRVAHELLEGNLDQQRRVANMLLVVRDKDEVKRLSAEIDGIKQHNQELLSTIEPLLQSEQDQALLASLKDRRKAWIDQRDEFVEALMGAKPGELDTYFFSTVVPYAERYSESVRQLLDAQQVRLDATAAQVERRGTQAAGLELMLAAIALLVGCGCAWWITRGIVRPLRRAVEIADGVAHGRLDLEIRDGGGDETGQLLRSLKDMQQLLRERAEADRVKAAQLARIKQGLDAVSTNVMIADNDLNILYVNPAILATLRNAEADLQKVLPQFKADELVGGNIDQFHRNPSHQRGLLARVERQHAARITIGARTFTQQINVIRDEHDARIGYVVEWKDITVELGIENEIAAIVTAAADGDFSQRIPAEGKSGFFLQLAENTNRLLETTNAGLQETARVLAAIADGDLTQTVGTGFKGTVGEVMTSINTTIAQLTQIIGGIQAASDTINTAAREIAAGNSDLSARTEQQAASLEETASSMEELTSTVKQNAENARQANQLAIGASDVAVKGGAVVAEVVTTMASISDASKKIADIIGVIDGIAFQTNILALNAAVEAARAGEQGRGFAVVASEVRSLAQRSASAAKEIKSLISDSTDRVGTGAKLVEQAGRTMDEIVGSVKRVTDIMGEITAASQEQSQGIEQVNQTITQMDEVTQQNAALVEEASASARSLEEQAGGLASSVARFRLAGAPAVAAASEPARPAAGAAPRAPAAKPRNARTRGKGQPQAAEGQWTEF